MTIMGHLFVPIHYHHQVSSFWEEGCVGICVCVCGGGGPCRKVSTAGQQVGFVILMKVEGKKCRGLVQTSRITWKQSLP